MLVLVKKTSDVILAKSKNCTLLSALVSLGLLSFSMNAKNIEHLGVNHKIIISKYEFIPPTLAVKVGDTVTWINKDIAPHNVIISNSQKIIAPNLAVDHKFIYKVSRAFEYECGFHPSMIGKIILEVGAQ